MQQDRVVLDAARHRADVVERIGQREHAGEAERAVGRLQPDDAAAGRRIAHRAAGVGAECRRHKSRGKRGAGAARRAAGMQVAVPRIARRRPGQVERWSAGGELVQRELAKQDRAGLVHLADREGVGRSAVILADLGVACRCHAGDVENVLRRIRHAVHRATIFPGGDLRFGGLGFLERAIAGDDKECVVGGIDRGDAVEQRLGPFDRRELAGAKELRALSDGEPGEVGHLLRSYCAGLNTCAGCVIGELPGGIAPRGRRPRSAAPFTPSGNFSSARLRPCCSARRRRGGLCHGSLNSSRHSGFASAASEPGIEDTR